VVKKSIRDLLPKDVQERITPDFASVEEAARDDFVQEEPQVNLWAALPGDVVTPENHLLAPTENAYFTMNPMTLRKKLLGGELDGEELDKALEAVKFMEGAIGQSILGDSGAGEDRPPPVNPLRPTW